MKMHSHSHQYGHKCYAPHPMEASKARRKVICWAHRLEIYLVRLMAIAIIEISIVSFGVRSDLPLPSGSYEMLYLPIQMAGLSEEH